MVYVIAEPYIDVKDMACVDACAVDCIHPRKDEADFESERMIYIDPIECIDCGACEPVCPVSAIFALDDLPEKRLSLRSEPTTLGHVSQSDVHSMAPSGCDARNRRIGSFLTAVEWVGPFRRFKGVVNIVSACAASARG